MDKNIIHEWKTTYPYGRYRVGMTGFVETYSPAIDDWVEAHHLRTNQGFMMAWPLIEKLRSMAATTHPSTPADRPSSP